MKLIAVIMGLLLSSGVVAHGNHSSHDWVQHNLAHGIMIALGIGAGLWLLAALRKAWISRK